MAKQIITSKNGRIAKITFNNPPMNVLTAQLNSELLAALEGFENDRDISVIIITGSGDRAFMAGADINEFTGEKAIYEKTYAIQQVLNKLENISKCTIAFLNGYTLGGGLELALCCDFRIAESHAQLGLPEVTLGLLPGAGGTQRLSRLIGLTKAKELLFTGEIISAHEALEIGILNKVFEKGEGENNTLKFAEKIASLSIDAIASIKKLTNSAHDTSLLEGLKRERDEIRNLYLTKNAQEGINAFKEKRKPKFNN